MFNPARALDGWFPHGRGWLLNVSVPRPGSRTSQLLLCRLGDVLVTEIALVSETAYVFAMEEETVEFGSRFDGIRGSCTLIVVTFAFSFASTSSTTGWGR